MLEFCGSALRHVRVAIGYVWVLWVRFILDVTAPLEIQGIHLSKVGTPDERIRLALLAPFLASEITGLEDPGDAQFALSPVIGRTNNGCRVTFGFAARIVEVAASL